MLFVPSVEYPGKTTWAGTLKKAGGSVADCCTRPVLKDVARRLVTGSGASLLAKELMLEIGALVPE